MRRRQSMGGGAALAVAALVVSIRCILGREYEVGGGYCIDATWYRNCPYQGWCTNKDFFVGDTLVFRFSSVLSTVAEVTKRDFDECEKSLLPANPIHVYDLSPVTVNLSTPGPFYIANTIEHCIHQRFAIIVSVPSPPSPDVVPATSTTPPSSPSTTTSTKSSAITSSSPPPPPPGKSSSSHGSSIAGEVTGAVFGVAAFLAKIWLVTYCVQKRKKKKQQLQSFSSESGEDPMFDHDHEMGEFEPKKVRG